MLVGDLVAPVAGSMASFVVKSLNCFCSVFVFSEIYAFCFYLFFGCALIGPLLLALLSFCVDSSNISVFL